LVVLVIGITVQRIVSLSRQHTLGERANTAVAALSTTRGALVPRAIQDLEKFPRKMVLEELRKQFEIADVIRKLSLAYALAHYEDVRTDFLVSQIINAPSDEVDNFVASLQNSLKEANDELNTIARKASSKANWRHKARLAIVALQLGEPSLGSTMCQLQPDPIQRTLFIEECSTWHGNLSTLTQQKTMNNNGPLRSAVALVVGSVPSGEVSTQDRWEWEKVLSDWFKNARDAGTHSAAGWALRKWKLKLPEIARSKDPIEGMEWHVNGLGVTMLRMPAGSFIRKEDNDSIERKIILTKPFLLADREVSIKLFQEFIDDPEYSKEEKPRNLKGVDREFSTTNEHPMQFVSWFDVLLFCNWLSSKEGLRPCYERTGEKEKYKDYGDRDVEYDAWRWIPDATGYRLATEAEWEYACRACSTTEFGFGDDESLLDRYVVYGASRTEIPGSKLPNGWGLFDMHGNIWEWCWDRYGPYGSEKLLTDPTGAENGVSRVLCGGSFSNYAQLVRSAYRIAFQPAYRFLDLGFRLARTYP
ncbi:MAG: formylglycine-generating enzyme family protein, partial [Pirellulales bacterium]|nr:formylglycine-generating enzyme family protein [Pirellulales bacterium]